MRDHTNRQHRVPTSRRAERIARLCVPLMLVGVGLGAAACSSPSGTSAANSSLAAGIKAQEAGDTGAATSDYLKALKEDPGNEYANYDLGLIDQEKGDVAGAEAYYRASLAQAPYYTPALFNLAIAVTSSNPIEAEELYRQVLAIDPTDAEAHLNLGYVLVSLGDHTEGESQISTALREDPALASSTTTTTASSATTTTVPATTTTAAATTTTAK